MHYLFKPFNNPGLELGKTGSESVGNELINTRLGETLDISI